MSATDDRTLEWEKATLLGLPGPFPQYGSDAYWAEPHQLTRRGSILVAAAAWRRESLPEEIAARLELQLEVERRAEDEHYAALFAGAQQVVHWVAKQPDIGTTYSQRRASELAEAIRPRPGDFPGLRHMHGGAA